MIALLKRLAARLPKRFQQSLKRKYFALQLRNHSFRADEPEFELASDLLGQGDWVLDIGANIGQYTIRFSELVGANGRVIAFEPVPDTFDLLSSNVSFHGARNVTLINAAASDSTKVVGFEIPKLGSGLDNFYMAHVSTALSDLNVLCIQIDSLDLQNSIRLVKIDAEGHDFLVLKGMKELLRRDKPIVFIEDNSDEVIEFLTDYGYTMRKLENSPNVVFNIPDRS